MMSDCELAFKAAMKIVYPDCILHSCHFHVTQALRKKAATIPYFLKTIVKDVKMNQLFHKFMQIAHLPPHMISGAFKMLKAEAATFKNVFTKFVKYFERQWMKGGGGWISVYGLSSRTNNLVESHNSTLSSSIANGSRFYRVISKLMEDEARKSHDIELILSGQLNTYRNQDNKYAVRSAIISKLQCDLVAGRISTKEFLLRLTNKYNTKVYQNLAFFPKGNVPDEEK